MTDYTRILVAIDFSGAADTVITRATDIARRNNAPLHLIHVVEYLPPIDIAYEPAVSASWVMDEDEMVQQAKTSLGNLCVKHELRNVEEVVVVGTPKHEISQYARDKKCDLVVLGSHGRHGIGLLLGSTANGVLHDMPCDVLAVKVGEDSE